MKILFLTRAYGLQSGGMERLSYELIQQVTKVSGVKVEVIHHAGPRSTSPLFNLTALPKTLSAASQADIIHLGDPMLSFLGWVVKTITRKPVVVTVHGLDITFPNFFYQMYLQTFFQNFDRYLPISQYVSRLLHTKFHISSNRSQVVNPGISDLFYDQKITREDLSQLLGQNTTSKKVLFTSGRLVKRKGHEWFIREVLPKLPENFVYVIAGDGPEKENIQKAISERSRQVILLGKVSDEQLKTLYNTVDAFIMPNIHVANDVEGFGLVLLEAALCNRPIFAANIDGISDAIQNGKNGMVLPSQNAEIWVKALKNISPQPTREYTLQNFNWGKVVQAYLKAINAVGK